MHDLDKLTIEELAALRDATIAKLAEKVAARQKELQAEMERVGGFIGKKERPAKYRHPTDPALTWGGTGTKPKWVVEHLAAGRGLEDLKT